MLLGLACVWAKADSIAHLLDEFQRIVLSIVTRVVIPLLPLFIATTFCALSYEGTITKQLPVFLVVVVIVIVGHYLWLAFIYGLAGAYAGKKPAAGAQALWPGVFDGGRHHVVCRHACRRAAVRE